VLNYLYLMCRRILKARLNVPHDVIIGYEVCDSENIVNICCLDIAFVFCLLKNHSVKFKFL